MTERSKLICSITAFMFLGLFVSIPYLPANLVLELYIYLTHKLAVVEMMILISAVMYFGIKDRDWAYALFLIIFMTGQVMFVHVYADNYIIALSQQIKKHEKIRTKYFPNWNKA